MRTFIFLPPLGRPTGGLAVLVTLAGHLVRGGFEAYFVPREGTSSPVAGIEARPFEDPGLRAEDIWLVPEGWANALAPGLKAGARCVVYCQNWAYLFSSLPAGVRWGQLPVSMLAVSAPVAWFVRETTGLLSPILRPGIDRDRFYPPPSKPEAKVRVAYMPRKNKALVEQIKEIFEARGGGEDVEWVSISGLDQDGVAGALRGAHLFLASGFPEGCPLPPLEAMACGCLPVGFGGFGGWDYMRQAGYSGPGAGFSPWLPLRRVPWGGNGLWTADADVPAAALCLEEAARWVREKDPRLDAALAAGRETLADYGLDQQREACLALWREARAGRLLRPGATP